MSDKTIPYVGAYSHFDYSGDKPVQNNKTVIFGIFDRIIFDNSQGVVHEFLIQKIDSIFYVWQRGDTPETRDTLFCEFETSDEEFFCHYMHDIKHVMERNGFSECNGF